MTILYPILAEGAGKYLIFSYCVKAVIAVNPIAAIAKYIIEKLAPIAVIKEVLAVRPILLRQAANNAAVQRNKAQDADSERQVPPGVVITTDNSNLYIRKNEYQLSICTGPQNRRNRCIRITEGE